MVAETDVVVIGGGMAGVTAAHHLVAYREVVVLEREDQLAQHTTGRSAAVYLENYGGLLNRALTIASRPFLDDPGDLAEAPLLEARGALDVVPEESVAEATALAAEGTRLVPSIRLVDQAEALALHPAVRPEHVAAAIWEPEASAMDVMALHQAFVRGAHAGGAAFHRGAEAVQLEPTDDGWLVTTPNATWHAAAVVNAAGAWGDVVAERAGVRPVGLVPMRRTAFTCAAPPEAAGWPLLHANYAPGPCYLKPETGDQLLGSLADETPSDPVDARPEELDIAIAIDRLTTLTNLEIRHVRTSWAGLRTFAPDRDPVIGWDDELPGFCWMVGQGGTGIQTAVAAGATVAGIVTGSGVPQEVQDLGATEAAFSPLRLRT
ncbi:MAG: FAD-binding oxidoreductase [Actinomycetia bacterium]|nr:FAD-binding oxidoreductase [Actinomycetes bacterium]